MRHTARALLVAVPLLLLVAPSPAGAAGGCQGVLPGLGAQLLDVPTHLEDDARAHASIIDEVNPGATIERRVRFSNGEPDQTLDLDLAALPATIDDGAFLIGPAGADAQLAGWIEMEQQRLTLGPCEHADVQTTIRVPAQAEGGERYAAITAEHVSDPDEAGVAMASRIGVRVYLQVAGPAPARSDLVIEELVPRRTEDGLPVIEVVVRNPGDRALDLSGEVELTDGPGGLRTDPVPTDLTITLAPGERGAATVPFATELPAGPWRAAVAMRSGDVERRAEARITFPDHGVGEAVPVHPLQDRGVLVPLAVGLLLLALLLLALVARRRRRDDEERSGGDVGPGSVLDGEPLVGTPGVAGDRATEAVGGDHDGALDPMPDARV